MYMHTHYYHAVDIITSHNIYVSQLSRNTITASYMEFEPAIAATCRDDDYAVIVIPGGRGDYHLRLVTVAQETNGDATAEMVVGK